MKKKKKEFPHAHYQTSTLEFKIWRKVESNFLVFGLQISEPNVEGWEQFIFSMVFHWAQSSKEGASHMARKK
jgi:hypothetical protein